MFEQKREKNDKQYTYWGVTENPGKGQTLAYTWGIASTNQTARPL